MRKILTVILLCLLVSGQPVYGEDYNNEPHYWFLNKSDNHQPAQTSPQFVEWLDKYGGFYLGDTDKKELYLTFDNGYENGYTSKILNVLKEKNVPAAFFVTGQFLKDQPDLVIRMHKEGHIVGNHSWHHPDLTDVSNKRLKRELKKVNEEYKALTGGSDMQFLRPPRGIFSERTLAISEQLGYHNVFWSLAYVDWERKRSRGADYAYDNIMEQIHPGAVLLLHSVSKDNANALSDVIDDLREQGYTFKRLDQRIVSQKIPKPFISP